MSLKQILGLDKMIRLKDVIVHNGGLIGSFKKIFRNDVLKMGTLVGTDKYGNRYYENNEYMHGANRWVDYANKVYLDYDASMIDADWYRWMHYITDVPPTKDATQPKHRWMIEHSENMTGTPAQYVPYSTTRPKITSWKPSAK